MYDIINIILIFFLNPWFVFIIAVILYFKYSLYTITFNYVQEKFILKYLKNNKAKHVYKYFANISYYSFIHVYLFNYFFYFTPKNIFLYTALVMLYLYYRYGLDLTVSIILLKTLNFCELVRLYPKIFLLVFAATLGIICLLLCITTMLYTTQKINIV